MHSDPEADKPIHQLLAEAVSAHKDGRLNEAERLYRHILRSDPQHPDANHNIGLIAVDVGEYLAALPYFETALSRNKKVEQFWLSYIDALIKSGDIFKARNLSLEALRSGVQSDKISSVVKKLNPSRKLEFFYKYLQHTGIFDSEPGKVVNGDLQTIPLLTNNFLNWFETQSWKSFRLLELGAGNSTIYFSNFFGSVTSYESNTEWFNNLSEKQPENVHLIFSSSIQKKLLETDLSNFEVILVDAAENRANLTRAIVTQCYNGIIFFDNSEWYRNSIKTLTQAGYIEVPFFGIKPQEDWVSCTSILGKPSNIEKILDSNWVKLPKLARMDATGSPWDIES
ncbi:MAG: hypothetical protein CBC24_07550 [Candidatus Pelagibacter sp. TMED64]|nr:MAG: hypothetical protein CBC24_07550 [Candidatus Pelagibacter sp. TMED64]|tara:strand:- start:289 stop:1308 length:1020 start_codon:yes stop_codon:yes gene_type:complete